MTRDRSLILLAAVATICATVLLARGVTSTEAALVAMIAMAATNRVSGANGEKP